MRRLMNCFVFILATFMLLSGCATITRGTKDTLVVESDPTGANVTLSNGLSGKTPATFKVPRGDAFLVKIEKEGYECVEVNVASQVCGAGGAGMAGNVLLGGLIGAAVDAGTGAMKELRPNPVSVKLVKINEPEKAPDVDNQGDESVTNRLEELKQLRDKGLITEEEFQQRRSKILGDL